VSAITTWSSANNSVDSCWFFESLSYEKELDIDNKLRNNLKITDILNNGFRLQKPLKKKRIKLCNTLALPVLLYGSESWTIKARDARRITAAKMKYMTRTAGYIWTDYKTNTQITKELKITQILDKLLEYKGNWLQHFIVVLRFPYRCVIIIVYL